MMKRSDVLLVKHFYALTKVNGDQDPKYDSILPGAIEIEPLWVYEPNKEKDGLKGATITVIPSRVLGRDGGEQNKEAILDLDELRDLDSALDTLKRADAPWRGQASGDHIEQEFSAKDSFSLSALHDASSQEVLYVEAGPTSAVLNFSKVGDVQRAVHEAIALLESKD